MEQTTTTTENKAYITRDWDNDGFMTIHNAKTLDTYRKLMYETHPNIEDYGVFYSYDIDTFREGYKRLVDRGYIKQGEKIVRTDMGLFGTPKEIKRYAEFYERKERTIAEQCDPQEVYWFEWDNFETMYDPDGDRKAMEIVIRIYGAERASKVSRTKDYMDIDEIIRTER